MVLFVQNNVSQTVSVSTVDFCSYKVYLFCTGRYEDTEKKVERNPRIQCFDDLSSKRLKYCIGVRSTHRHMRWQRK